jgi:tetratricopeptide (TPR) repeat protein
MEKSILAAAQMMMLPFIEETRKKREDSIREPGLLKGGIQVPEEIVRERAKKEVEELQKFLLGEEELALAEEGYEIVLSHLSRSPHYHDALNSLKDAGDRLLEEPDESDEPELHVFDTVQEIFGISKEVYDAMYQIGVDLVNKGNSDDALKVFALLTTLNNLVFEPWLVIGTLWQTKGRYPEALHAFTMASLLKFEDPAPHIYAAEVYIALDQKKLSQETLSLALSLMDDQAKADFDDHIKYLKENLKAK